MEDYLITALNPQQKLLEAVESQIKNSLKKKEEYEKFEAIFIDIGVALCGHETEGSESDQKKTIAFSKEKMQQLAQRVYEADPFMWQKIIESTLRVFGEQVQMDVDETRSCIERAIEMFQRRLAKQYPQIQSLIMLDHVEDEIKVAGERNEKQLRVIERNTQLILEHLEMAVETRDVRAQDTDMEVSAPNFDSMMREIPVSEEEEWVLESPDMYGFRMDEKKRRNQRGELTMLWAKERESYPGYYVLPYNKAKELSHKTDGYGGFLEEKVTDFDEVLNFSYEYCWRWKHAMFIISHQDCRRLRCFFEAYEDHLREQAQPAEKVFQWFYIGLCILGDAREELDASKWNAVYDALKNNLEIAGEYRLECEELLWLEEMKMKYAQMRLSEVISRIRERIVHVNSYPVRLQLAGILAECGEVLEAAGHLQTLENALISRLNSNVPEESEQRYLLSILSCAYQLHRVLFTAFEWQGNKEECCPELPADRKGLDDYFCMDRELESVRADMLKWLYDTEKKRATTFDIGRETVTVFGSGTPTCEGGYYLYRMLDAMAYPMEVWNMHTLPVNVVYYMQSAIFQMCPMLGCQLLLRGSNQEYIKRNFNHLFLAQCAKQVVYEMLDYVLKAFWINMYEFKKHTGVMRQNQFSYLLENGLELLCRLASRSAVYQHADLLKIVAELMNENCVTNFGAMDRLISYVLGYVPESTKAEYMNLFLGTAILQRTPIGRKGQVDAFEMLNRNESTTPYFYDACINEGYVDELLARRISNPAEYMVRLERLIELYRFQKLSQEQEERFIALLWQRRSQKNGLPDLPDRYMFSFLELPAPGDVDVLGLIKDAIVKWPWQKELDGDGHKITMGNVRCFDELKGLCDYFIRKGIIGFSGEEAYALIKDFEAYWDENKNKLSGPEGIREEIKTEFRKRFEKMQMVIVALLKCCNQDEEEKISVCVKNMYTEMYAYGIASINIKLLIGNEEERESCVEEILDVLYTGEKTTAALGAAYDILTSHALDPKAESDFLLQILRIARAGKEGGFASLLAMLHNLFYSKNVVFGDNHLKELGKVLENIRQQFLYEKCENEKEIKNIILVRHFAALLAYRIYLYCRERNVAAPDSVTEWKKICDGDEFMDVKNGWLTSEG